LRCSQGWGAMAVRVEAFPGRQGFGGQVEDKWGTGGEPRLWRGGMDDQGAARGACGRRSWWGAPIAFGRTREELAGECGGGWGTPSGRILYKCPITKPLPWAMGFCPVGAWAAVGRGDQGRGRLRWVGCLDRLWADRDGANWGMLGCVRKPRWTWILFEERKARPRKRGGCRGRAALFPPGCVAPRSRGSPRSFVAPCLAAKWLSPRLNQVFEHTLVLRGERQGDFDTDSEGDEEWQRLVGCLDCPWADKGRANWGDGR